MTNGDDTTLDGYESDWVKDLRERLRVAELNAGHYQYWFQKRDDEVRQSTEWISTLNVIIYELRKKIEELNDSSRVSSLKRMASRIQELEMKIKVLEKEKCSD